MTARLILNADDFGLTRGVNRAVAELHAAGVLSSATLMASGAAFDDAVEIAKMHTKLGVGCHVVLTDGLPVSDPEAIPTLMNAGGASLRPSLAGFIAALLTGRISEQEIEHEALAQIRKLQRAGIQPTHLDTHKHTHLFPSVLRPLLRAAVQTGVPAIRSPFEPEWAANLPHGSSLRRAAVRLTRCFKPRFQSLLHRSGLVSPGGTLAISATGELTADILSELLRAMPQHGTYELCCHPGYNDADLDHVTTRLREHRDLEREALLRIVPSVRADPLGPSLVDFAALSLQDGS